MGSDMFRSTLTGIWAHTYTLRPMRVIERRFPKPSHSLLEPWYASPACGVEKFGISRRMQ